LKFPPVPEGSAVEFAVDYAAGTSRVAFYTPAAVAGRFVEAPYARMELRFVATDAEDVPDWGGAIPTSKLFSYSIRLRVRGVVQFARFCEFTLTPSVNVDVYGHEPRPQFFANNKKNV
jgi:hypothetical protein